MRCIYFDNVVIIQNIMVLLRKKGFFFLGIDLRVSLYGIWEISIIIGGFEGKQIWVEFRFLYLSVMVVVKSLNFLKFQFFIYKMGYYYLLCGEYYLEFFWYEVGVWLWL